MYIQITDRCNMSCGHCCFSCTSKGNDMPLDMFKELVDNLADKGSQIFLGGGEPTLHPNFLEMIGYAVLANTADINIGIVTNGSNTKLTKLLLNGFNNIFCQVSIDQFHDSIDPEIVRLVEKLRCARSVKKIMPVGRGVNYATVDQGCPTNDMFCSPTGIVYACGCRKKIIGNYQEWDDNYEGWECIG